MESFWEASGASSPLILEVEGDWDARMTRHVSDRPFLRIGRGEWSDIVLDHPDVSQRHAYLQIIGGQPFCVDLESRTGTLLAGGTPAGGWVSTDQPIRIGPYRIRTAVGEAANSAGPRPISPFEVADDPWPRIRLEVQTQRGWQAVPITRTLTLIGRSRRCKIRLTTPESSRFQAALLRTPTGTWAVDLGSTDGLSINGDSVDFARLSIGDEIRAGSLVARVGNPSADSSPGRTLASTIDHSRGPSAGDFQAILDQVAEIQHQSNDQLRQVIVMVTQLFGSMHRETMDLVREELEQIRNLAVEMKAIRDGQAGAAAPPPPTLKVGPVADDRDEAALGMPRDPGEIHLIVSERLAAFEHERRGRWGKLSKILSNSGS